MNARNARNRTIGAREQQADGFRAMPKTILIVDDEQNVRDLIRIALTSQRDYTVHEADNGLDGIERMKELLPDLVLVDMHMPGLNGYQFVVRVQKDETLKRIPLFVITSMTADSKKSDDDWAKSLGVAAFQTKPFDPIALIKRIDAVLGVA